MKHVGISKIVAKMSLCVSETLALKEACVLFDFWLGSFTVLIFTWKVSADIFIEEVLAPFQFQDD